MASLYLRNCNRIRTTHRLCVNCRSLAIISNLLVFSKLLLNALQFLQQCWKAGSTGDLIIIPLAYSSSARAGEFLS